MIKLESDGSSQVFEKFKLKKFNRLILLEGMRVEINGIHESRSSSAGYNHTGGTIIRFDEPLSKWLVLCDVDGAVNAFSE